MPTADASAIERVFRDEYGRAVALLVRTFGDIEIAEDAVQDAFATAVQRWPSTGVPPSPAGWVITTARNRAIDRLRREASRGDRHAQAFALQHAGDQPPEEDDSVRDDRLRLIFACCHPALAPNIQVALTLRLIGGLTTAEIARAFLVPEQTLAQRLVREDLCREAIRLGRVLLELMRDEPEILGLLALMLLIEARRGARVDADDQLVLLPDQDRGRWDRLLIEERQAIVRRCLGLNQPGPYQVQAAINAAHCDRGCTVPVGLLPALIACQPAGARWLKVASPRIERQELPVQRKRTFMVCQGRSGSGAAARAAWSLNEPEGSRVRLRSPALESGNRRQRRSSCGASASRGNCCSPRG